MNIYFAKHAISNPRVQNCVPCSRELHMTANTYLGYSSISFLGQYRQTASWDLVIGLDESRWSRRNVWIYASKSAFAGSASSLGKMQISRTSCLNSDLRLFQIFILALKYFPSSLKFHSVSGVNQKRQLCSTQPFSR